MLNFILYIEVYFEIKHLYHLFDNIIKVQTNFLIFRIIIISKQKKRLNKSKNILMIFENFTKNYYLNSIENLKIYFSFAC